MEKVQRKNKSLLPILLTVFIDMLGIGIVIPILAPLLVNGSGIYFEELSFLQRSILLGLLIASYPFAQFFGAPILGGLSDKHGRKPILLLSLVGTLIGYLFQGIGINQGLILLLIIGRLIDGFTGGNISTAYSAIADLSNRDNKARNFGLVGMTFGIGFILGPFIGGKLSDPLVNANFTYSTPFFFASLLTIINILVVWLVFEETLKVKIQTKISVFTGFINIKNAWNLINLRKLFIISFLLIFGFTFFTQFFQVYLIERFNFSQSQIGNLFAYLGLWIAITQGVILRLVSKNNSSEKILKASIFMLAISFVLVLLIQNPILLLFTTPLIAISNGLTNPNITALISNAAAKDSQGEILGINQSISALAQMIPPILAGISLSINLSLPILFAALFIFIAWTVFVKYISSNDKIIKPVFDLEDYTKKDSK